MNHAAVVERRQLTGDEATDRDAAGGDECRRRPSR